jgi:N-acylneuraminate cytidylyltransferase
MVELDGTGRLQVSKPLPGGVWARQNAPVVYEHVGLVYVVDPAYLRRAKTIYEGRVIPYVIPSERCHDIDTPYDMRLVEFLLSEQLREGLVKV